MTPTAGKTAEKKKEVTLDEHTLPIEEVCSRYNTHIDFAKPGASNGLPKETQTARQAQYGPNMLCPPKRVHPFLKFLHCLTELFTLMLIIAGILTYILYFMDPIANATNVYIGGILIIVSVMNAAIEWYQQQQSENMLNSFMNLIPAKCTLIRDGALIGIPATELVPGDVVHIKMGDKVPADVIIFKATDLKVDNSSLTGEGDPQERTVENTHQNPLEATNLCFNGSLAVSGEGFGIVIRTGDSTVLGQIAGMTGKEKKRQSPMSQEIARFGAMISTIAMITAIIFFTVSFVKTKSLAQALNFAVGVLVAFVPQGLPLTISMLLTIAAKRMATQQVLVKDLQGVETLGAITLLATDKTGTLTRNQMTVTNIWASQTLFNVADAKESLQSGEVVIDFNVSGVQEIINMSVMCSRARFDRSDVPIAQRSISGDATESGLFRFASEKIEDVDNIEVKYPKVFELPFNSDTKWHMAILKMKHPNGIYTLYMKGAPERVLSTCSTILKNGEAIPLNDEVKSQFLQSYEYMAGKGHRVLAFAQLLLNENDYPVDTVFTKEAKNYPTTNLCFVGLVSLEDPPKHGVREAIGNCRRAGIKVMMVTGDHPLTAEAIGRKINLMLGETKEGVSKRTGKPIIDIKECDYNAIVIHGEKIATLTDQDWDNIFSKDEIIFARTSPKNKLEIVKRAQGIGHIVGVTGDGVNDSPALKKADLGIAMNQSGSDVSKEAAAMILLDDNFASTVKGVIEGRLIFQNLKKSIQYTVTHIIPEVIPFVFNVVIPFPVALNSIQILLIDLGFEIFAALSFAWEPPESAEGLMRLEPRRPVNHESIIRLREENEEAIACGNKAPLDENGNPLEAWEEPPAYKRFLNKIVRKKTWLEAFRSPDGDILVDGEVLSYAYLEGGVIETLGAFLAFFYALGNRGISVDLSIQMQNRSGFYSYATVFVAGKNETIPIQCTGNTTGCQPWAGWTSQASDISIMNNGTMQLLTATDQLEILAQGQSAYYLAVMIIQMWNLFACKSKLKLPFGRHMIANNKTWFCLLIGGCLGLILIYVKELNGFFGSSYNLPWITNLIPMGAGAFLIIYVAIRRLILRQLNPTRYNPDIKGLQMYPTRWSR